jgi:hypothetical protein
MSNVRYFITKKNDGCEQLLKANNETQAREECYSVIHFYAYNPSLKHKYTPRDFEFYSINIRDGFKRILSI